MSTSVTVFNWLIANAPAGSVINWSHELTAGDPLNPCAQAYSTSLSDAVYFSAHSNLFVIVAAGNDGCDTADFTPTAMAEAFVVGATSNTTGYDARWVQTGNASRVGTNISTWAPGNGNLAMDQNGNSTTSYVGTSLAAPMVAGLAAVACSATGTYCATTYFSTVLSAFRATGATGTVTEPGGGTLSGSSPSRFIWQQW